MTVSAKTEKQDVETKSHKIGYARVSTEDQNLALQIDALIAAGVDERDIYKEKVSAVSKKRPEFEAMWKDLRTGDTLVVWRGDRIHRDAAKFWAMLEELKRRDVKLITTTQPGLDVRSPEGEFMAGILACVAQYERSLGVSRTKAGLQSAAKEGRKGGRRRIISDEQALAVYERVKAGEFLADIAAAWKPKKMTPQAFYNRWKALGLGNPVAAAEIQLKKEEEDGE